MSEQGLPTHPIGPAPAPAPPAVSIAPKTPAGAARQRAGRARGGKNGRAVALIGLGDELPATLSLRTSEDRMAVLEATLAAVARGKTSGLVASTITSLVRVANELARGDQEEQIRALERRIEALVLPGR